MAQVSINCTKDASVIGMGIDGWSGYDNHHPVGRSATNSYTIRSFLYFAISFTGMTAINAATLYLREHTSAPYHAHFDGGSAIMYTYPMTSDWGECTNRGETNWSTGEVWTWSNRAGQYANP